MKFSFGSIFVPTFFTVSIWMIFGLQFFGFFQECYGIIPHDTNSLRGILFAPLFHGNLEHIVNNTIPMFVLLFLSFLFYQRITYLILVFGWILSGFFVWTFPYFSFLPNESFGCHIGASGLIYLFVAFLFFSGIIRRNIQLMAISLLIVFLYGSLIWGIFPQELFTNDPNAKLISWESHLSGALVGIVLAVIFRNYGPQKTIFPWQRKNHIDNQSEELWQAYQEDFPEDFEEQNKNPKPFRKNDWDRLL